jgi:DNA-binding NarL/FixJ family response regulator
MTRVAVVASSPVLRAGLESLLAAAASLVVVGSVADRHDHDDDAVPLAELVAPLAPDVVVWVADGDRDALPRLADDAPGLAARRPAVVLLADLADPRAAVRALRAGVRGVLPREAGVDEIVAAVEAVAAGLLALPAELADELLARVAPEPVAAASAPAAGASLTPREREVLTLLAQGLANKAIAPRLHISEHTVKAHVASIFEKLGAGTRAEAVVTAARLGILML